MVERSAADVLASARTVLGFAQTGEVDYAAAGDRRLSGLYNAVTSGRSVTFVLQNLKHRVEGFDAWYGPHQAALKADPVCRFFVDLRNRIEKEGSHGGVMLSVQLKNFNPREVFRAAPPGSDGFNDGLGRAGWNTILPDGSKHTVHFAPPSDVVRTTLKLEDAPDGRDIGDLLSQWLGSLELVVADAERQFGSV